MAKKSMVAREAHRQEIVDKYGVTKAYAEQILSGKLRKLLYLEVTTSIAPWLIFINMLKLIIKLF